MCNKVDNNCREEKRGCEGCYYNELINKFYEYKISISDVRKISEIVKKIILQKYHCQILDVKFRQEEIIVETYLKGLVLNLSFNIEYLLRTELNEDYILNCVDYAILSYYRKD